jgi:enamine deaminase RidA (YjgF/YER057c/UK114 family)
MKMIVAAPTLADLPYSAGVVAGGLCFVAGQFGVDAKNCPKGRCRGADGAGARCDRGGARTGRQRPRPRSAHDRLAALARGFRGDERDLSRASRRTRPRVTVQVADLLFEAAVEIDAIALVPGSG